MSTMGIDPSAKPGKKRWKRRLIIAGSSFLIVVLLLAGGLVAYVAYRNHQVHRVHVGNLAPVSTKGPHANAQTILMIGSTSRCVLNNKQAGAFGSCAAGITGVNSDVIMLLHVDPNNHRLSLLSLPRDLVLPNVRPGQFHKIDAALADGPGQLVKAIEQDFGIPINHYVELNFDSFQNVVNALGGINMYFPTRVHDNFSSLNIMKTGCHHLNGFQALAVVRARHMSYGSHLQYYDGSGDLGRIIRDHEFLRVLAAEVAKRGLGNLLTDNSLVGALAPQLTVDQSFSLGDMVSLVWNFHSVNPNKIPEATLPNIEDYTYYTYQGIPYGSVVFPSYPADQRAIDSFLGITAPPGASVKPSSISVSVINGSGTPATGPTTVSKLSSLGFHASLAGTQTPVGSPAETLVQYSAGHLNDAERVARSLSGIVAMARAPTAGGADVTVIAGTTFHVVMPPAPGSHPSSGHHSPSGSSLGSVSSPIQKLPWYDPRACPAG
ncbi:MAG: LCP family protein [Acidimicrobiales bacterium]